MKQIVLYKEKKDCCGCGACGNVCPRSAIRMQEDDAGFVYPVIDEALCVSCGACTRVCPCRNDNGLRPVQEVYGAAAKDGALLMRSSSGGAFAVLAGKVLEGGGVVYGRALESENGTLEPRHIRIDSADRLPLLQGSKYVQSDMGDTYRQAKQDLLSGKTVLFTGTPCQIAALKRIVQGKDDGLLTVEIICHGVPGKRMFQQFLEFYGKTLGGRITGFWFRDKRKGQGMISRCVCQDPSGALKEHARDGNLIAYVFFFLKSYTYRDSCYHCPFARPERAADITLGDFWGFHEEYPRYREPGGLSNGRGISCVLLNTKKGKALWEDCREKLVTLPSTFEKVARHNEQLNRPCQPPPEREALLQVYAAEGYPGMDRVFRTRFRKDIAGSILAGMIPKDLKRTIKRCLGRLRSRK